MEAPDGAAALRLIEEGGVDLVLARTHTPEWTDSSCAGGFRAHDKTAAVPVVLLATAQSRWKTVCAV